MDHSILIEREEREEKEHNRSERNRNQIRKKNKVRGNTALHQILIICFRKKGGEKRRESEREMIRKEK